MGFPFSGSVFPRDLCSDAFPENFFVWRLRDEINRLPIGVLPPPSFFVGSLPLLFYCTPLCFRLSIDG